MFSFCSKNRCSKISKTEYGRVRVSSNSHSIHLPKTNSTLPISFTVSKIHWIWWEVRVFNGKTASFKALSLFLFHSDIQSPDTNLQSIFPLLYICLLFVTCTCRQRNRVSNTLRLKLFFYLLLSPLLPSRLLCLERLCMDFYLIQLVKGTPSQRVREAYERKKEDRALQTCQELQCPFPEISVQNS